MEILIVVLLSVIAILLAVLIFVLLKKKVSKIDDIDYDKKEYVNSLKSRGNLSSITLLALPVEVESLSNIQVRDISRKILRIYESLDYKNNNDEYIKDSWHSWQVSILLSLYKRDMELFIPNQANIFKDEIVDQSESSLKELISKILNKYKNEVKINLNKEILSKNRIWNGEEVSIILYFLSKYKNFK